MSHHRLARRAVAAAALTVLAGPSTAGAATLTTEAESLALSASSGMVRQDASASGGRSLLLWSSASATGSVTTRSARRISVRVRGDQCAGAPEVAVEVDGRRLITAAVASTTWTSVATDAALADGAHALTVRFTNDAVATGCDRNLHVDGVTFTSTAAMPLAGASLWVDPWSPARTQADAWRATRPGDAAVMDRLAKQPQADWFGGWSGDVQAAVSQRLAAAGGAVPVLVAYNIPQRDCGGASAGGVGSADAYRAWIRAFAAGIGTRRAIVVVEPDALALDCLSTSDRETRYALLRDAVAVLTARPGVSVYLDAGHARWLPAEEAASRLVRAGADDAQGFGLNVSNFVTTEENVAYGRLVAAAAGGKHFVIDTSRNGLGPTADAQWCNPPGRALGPQPSTGTVWSSDRRHDANLWIKRPGESDGPCNGGPAAGAWWPEYALGLARAAGW
jgi:endoglucanase